MADYKDSPLGRQDAVYTHDEGDGTFSRASAGHNRGWDATDGAWYRLPVDHTTGALLVKATLAAGSVDVGSVDQGTGGASAWLISGAVTASQTGTWGVSISNAPSVSVTSGSITANAGTNLNTSLLALDSTLTGGSQQVQGNIAAAATDSGNPVKIGGKFNTTPPTLTDGQRGDAQVSALGFLKVALHNSATNISAIIGTPGDGGGNNSGLWVNGQLLGFNGSNYDQLRARNADGLSTGVLNVMTGVYNGSTIDRLRGDTTSGAYVQTKAEVATAAEGATTQPSVAKVIGGWDGIAVRAATVKSYNGFNQLFVRDQALAGLLSEILMELKLSNSYEEVVT